MGMSDLIGGSGSLRPLRCAPDLIKDWPTFLNRFRLGQLEDRLSRCADKIALRSFVQLLEALERPKPRACRAIYRQRLLAVEVEGLYTRRLAAGARKVGLRDYIIHDVEHRRRVSESTIRTALRRDGAEARDALRMRIR